MIKKIIRRIFIKKIKYKTPYVNTIVCNGCQAPYA